MFLNTVMTMSMNTDLEYGNKNDNNV